MGLMVINLTLQSPSGITKEEIYSTPTGGKCLRNIKIIPLVDELLDHIDNAYKCSNVKEQRRSLIENLFNIMKSAQNGTAELEKGNRTSRLPFFSDSMESAKVAPRIEIYKKIYEQVGKILHRLQVAYPQDVEAVAKEMNLGIKPRG